MPRIKSPISLIEENYNKRYNKDTQQYYLKMIDQRKLDKHANDFVMSCKFSDGAGQLILTERQADYLAELYDKYSS